jgi:hypothetical protein
MGSCAQVRREGSLSADRTTEPTTGTGRAAGGLTPPLPFPVAFHRLAFTGPAAGSRPRVPPSAQR